MKKSSWIVVGLVFVLGLIYTITKNDKVSVGIKHIELPAFNVEIIDKIEIIGPEKIKLLKVDGTWKVNIGDDNTPRLVNADQATVESAIKAASGLRHSYYVTELAEKLPELGLNDEASTTIKLFAKENIAWALVLGKSTEGSSRYAKLLEDKNVYVVKASFWELTRGSAIDFRDKTILALDEAELISFSIKSSGKTSIAVKKDDVSGAWQFDESENKLPPKFRTNQSALLSLVQSGTKIYAQGFIDEEKNLDNPVMSIVMDAKDNKQTTLNIYTFGEDKFFAKKSDDKQLFQIDKSIYERFKINLADFRDLSLMKFDEKSIVELSINAQKQSVRLQKNDEKWQISEPKKLADGFEFDENTVDSTIAAIQSLRAKRLADLAVDKPKELSWQSTPLLKMLDNEGKNIQLFLAKSKNTANEYLIKGNIDQEIYIIEANKVSYLENGLNVFKKQEFEMPPIDENTKGFDSLPVDIQRKLLDATKKKN